MRGTRKRNKVTAFSLVGYLCLDVVVRGLNGQRKASFDPDPIQNYQPEALNEIDKMGSLPNNEKVDVQIGSNRPGPHPASDVRPVHHPEWEKPLPSGYSVSNHMIGEVWPPNKDQAFKIVVMGAGAAGIDFLHHAIAGLADLNIEIKCFEKNRDVGGTWFENRYPGCACDGPSATYQFPWRPNPDWTRFYSGSKEIWEYLKAIATDEDMYKYITLNTTVINATWNETRAKWVLVLEHTDKSRRWEEECDLFLNGAGFLK